MIWGSLGRKSSVFQPLQLARRFSLFCVARWTVPTLSWQCSRHGPQTWTTAKAEERKQGQPFPSTERLQQKHIRCELSPLRYHSLRAKSCSRHSIHKRQKGSREGCVGTHVNPRHVCSKRNTRNEACGIKRLPD